MNGPDHLPTTIKNAKNIFNIFMNWHSPHLEPKCIPSICSILMSIIGLDDQGLIAV